MRGWQKSKSGRLAALVLVIGLAGGARADSRLAWTGGVSQVEGAGGGGLVPWALITGLGTEDETGGSAFATHVRTARFSLQTEGVAVGWRDRVEVSFARQRFDIGVIVPGTSLGQDIWGAKVRLFGDAVADQDRWLPQVAAGALYKRTLDFDAVPAALGATHAQGVDVYLAATKVMLAAVAGRNVLLDATVRRSSANQLGLLGFGGPEPPAWRVEGTAGMWVADSILVGAEVRGKRGALAAPAEGDAHDVFVAIGPSKHLSIVIAFADLGPVAGQGRERGPYLSVAGAF